MPVQLLPEKKQKKHYRKSKKPWVFSSLKKIQKELSLQFPFLGKKPNYFIVGAFLILLAFYGQTLYTRQFSYNLNLVQENNQTTPKKVSLLKQVNAAEVSEVINATVEAERKPRLSSSREAVVPVLMYHYIQPSLGRDKLTVDLSVQPEHFEEQMNYLAANSFTTISPQELENFLQYGFTLPLKPIILTFDDGYRDFYTNAYPILKKYKLKATNFIPTGLVNNPSYLQTNDIKELSADPNITLAGHTVNHVDLPMYSDEDALKELINSKNKLEEILSREVRYFAYPYGSFDDRVVSLVARAGYKLAFTTVYGSNQTFSAMLFEPRVRISGNDSLSVFISKVSFQK